jgi:hypothetical protein
MLSVAIRNIVLFLRIFIPADQKLHKLLHRLLEL